MLLKNVHNYNDLMIVFFPWFKKKRQTDHQTVAVLFIFIGCGAEVEYFINYII